MSRLLTNRFAMKEKDEGLYFQMDIIHQYGLSRLEFDEIFDKEQMKRVGDLILRLSSRR